LVVLAIIALLAALLFPIFIQAKETAKSTSCLSNTHTRGAALAIYVGDYDGRYPQTRRTSADPSTDDGAGELEEPDFGTTERLLAPYLGQGDGTAPCPSDDDPKGKRCDQPFPDHPELGSYVSNGWFAFGLKESDVKVPADTVFWAERRSDRATETPFCNYLYRPWFNSTNPKAPENDMHPTAGALSSRHSGGANYTFADGHTKKLRFEQTYAPGVDMHRP